MMTFDDRSDPADERRIIAEIAELLEAGRETEKARITRSALAGREEQFERFLVSNELWGGAGSIADESLIADNIQRRVLEDLLIQIGRIQCETNRLNPRTEMWVAAFEKWHSPI